MGIGDRITSGAVSRIGIAADAATRRVRHTSAGFRGLRELLRECDESISVESVLVALVEAVRHDDRDEDRSARDVFEAARRRRRRLGFASFGAGPMAGMATHAVDLYCEVAVVCDLADIHDLGLSEQQIAAHMLVLWGFVESFDEAEDVMSNSSGRTVAAIIAERVGGLDIGPPSDLTKRDVIRVLWEGRGLLGDLRSAAGMGSVRGVVFAGRRAKQLIKKAEDQLGI